MAALTGLYISQSYGGVIHLSTNTGIVTGSFTQLQDGFGTNLGVFFNGQGGISGSLTGSLFGTASFATTASYALNAATAASFPFSGSAQITGSLGITGSISSLVKVLTISSQTASMDFDAADMFTLTLVSGSNTFINPTNVRAGRTAALQVTQAAVSNGTVTFPSSVTFANNVSGSSATSSAYVPSPGTGSVDIVTFACFSGSILRATPINLFLPVS